MLTFLPIEQIDEMDKWEGSQLNEAKKILAHELTTMVHGEEKCRQAEEAAAALFAGGAASDNIPTYQLKAEDFKDGKIDIMGILSQPVFARAVAMPEEISSRAA